MARASTATLLPLDKFAKLVGINPLHFNQVFVSGVTDTKVCDTPLLQYSWQEADRIGREELAYAISNAEDVISSWLEYHPLPTWQVAERVNFKRPAMPELFNIYGVNVRGLWQSAETNWGHVISGGQKALTLIEAGSAIVYSDVDSDTYKETATVTCATTVTAEDEIAIFYPGHNGDSEWEIKPITVRIVAGVATIVFRREQCVLEDLMEAFNATGVEGTVDANFLDEVDVYRKWNDPQTQVQFMWENAPNLCDCGLSTCASCTFSTQYGCLQVRDRRLGLVTAQPATWSVADQHFDSTSFVVGRQPERADIWYRAGYRDETRRNPNIDMAPNLERAIMMLTISMLDRPLCGCGHLESLLAFYQEELSKSFSKAGVSVSFKVNKEILENPFGTKRGAVEAWRIVNRGYPSIGD